jgi:nitroreductase
VGPPPHDPRAALALLLGQRACRAYAAEPVEPSDLDTMLEAATHAPSAENSQPWVFVVVRDPEVRRAVDELTARVWDEGGRAHAAASLEPRFFTAVDEFLRGGYGGAPVLVVVAGDGRRGARTGTLAASVFPAAQNLLLAAAALGYGSAMTTLAAQAHEELAAIVHLPEGIRPFAVVPVGRPRSPLGPPRRRPVAEVAHLDAFGTALPAVSDRRPAPDGAPRPPRPRA